MLDADAELAAGAPAPPVQRRRTAASVRTDEQIIDAALAQLIEHGVDAMSLRHVGAAAGVSHTAVYARFDDKHDLLAELWQQRCCALMARVVELAASGVTDGVPDLAGHEPVVQDAAVHAALTLCATSSRLRDVGDIAPRDVVTALRRAGVVRDERIVDEMRLGFVALLFGTVMAAPVLQSAYPNVDVARDAVIGGRRPWDGPPPPRFVTHEFRFDENDSLRGRLLRAAAAVIADSGMGNATLKRIGRRARTAPTAMYAIYPTRQDMLLDMMRRHARFDDAAEDSVASIGPAHAHAALLAGWADPRSAEARRLILEMYSAAKYDGVVRDVLAGAWNEKAQSHAAKLSTSPERQAVARLMVDIGATVDIGVALLADVCGPAGVDVGACDWRHFTSSLMRGLYLASQ